MKKLIPFLFICIAAPLILNGQIQNDVITLRATHHLGVPLHDEYGGQGSFQRVADRTLGKVLELKDEGHWLKILTSNFEEGWIIEKYVGSVVSDQPDINDQIREQINNEQIWSTPEDCITAVNNGERLSKDQNKIRVGTWNIRWFPVGCMYSNSCPENKTHIDWLASAITWLELDVLAVQEFVFSNVHQSCYDELIEKLNTLSGGDWKIDLQDCGHNNSQRLGFLWNNSVVKISNTTDVGEMNGAVLSSSESDCASSLRPGRYAYVESRSDDGVDFHIVCIHLDSGTTERDYNNRRTVWSRFIELYNIEPIVGSLDMDLIVLGDFNTMGCSSLDINADEEVEELETTIADGFKLVETHVECSEYYDGKAGLLDWIIYNHGMAESNIDGWISGYCSMKQCDVLDPDIMPDVYERISDHCPVFFDIVDKDLD